MRTSDAIDPGSSVSASDGSNSPFSTQMNFRQSSGASPCVLVCDVSSGSHVRNLPLPSSNSRGTAERRMYGWNAIVMGKAVLPVLLQQRSSVSVSPSETYRYSSYSCGNSSRCSAM